MGLVVLLNSPPYMPMIINSDSDPTINSLIVAPLHEDCKFNMKLDVEG
jgi:hypothetical protein